MSGKEADNLRRSNRIILKEGSVIESLKLADSDLAKERLKVSCSVVGCDFKTEYLPPLLAQQQSSEHWRARHKAKFEKEELAREKARKLEEMEQEMELEEKK